MTKVAYLCWQIWKRRCAIIHGQERANAIEVINYSESCANEWMGRKVEIANNMDKGVENEQEEDGLDHEGGGAGEEQGGRNYANEMWERGLRQEEGFYAMERGDNGLRQEEGDYARKKGERGGRQEESFYARRKGEIGGRQEEGYYAREKGESGER